MAQVCTFYFPPPSYFLSLPTSYFLPLTSYFPGGMQSAALLFALGSVSLPLGLAVYDSVLLPFLEEYTNGDRKSCLFTAVRNHAGAQTRTSHQRSVPSSLLATCQLCSD